MRVAERVVSGAVGRLARAVAAGISVGAAALSLAFAIGARAVGAAERPRSRQPGAAPAVDPSDEPPEEQLTVSTLVLKPALVGSIVEHEELGPVAFSPDGSRAAYVVRRGRLFSLVLAEHGDELIDEAFDEVQAPVFSADGQQMAYVAFRIIRGKSPGLVSVGNAVGVSFDNFNAPVMTTPGATTSDSGQPTAGSSSTKPPRQAFLVIASKQESGSSQLVWSIWSAAGTDAAYRDGRGAEGPVKTFVAIADGLADPNQARDMRRADVTLIGPPVFSPDGLSLACPAEQDGKALVIAGRVDGGGLAAGAPFESVRDLVFNADGSRVAYKARFKGKTFVVAAGQISGPFDDLPTPLVFREDGHALSFGVRQDDALAWQTLELP